MKQKRTNRHDISVQNILKHIDDGSMSLNHPLQRRAGQWDKKRKGNLIRRLLWGDDIQPIHICTQYDETGMETEYVIDGKQRLTSIQEYINGSKAFSSIPATVTKPIITYTGVVYQTKTLKSGAVRLVTKKNRRTKELEFVPVLDENGKKQHKVLEFDIRGAKFEQLPPELKERIQEYMLPALYKEDCTDEDIQQEIIDFNSGMPMCKEQKGVTKLGVTGMDKITQIVQSDFIRNYCEFDENAEKKAKIERRIVESVCYLYLDYMKDYEAMCELVATDLLDDYVSDYLKILDTLKEACVSDDVRKYLGKTGGKEYPIVMACFDYFRTLDYDIEAFRHFLETWVTSLCDKPIIEVDGEYLSYAEKYKHSDTSVGVLKDKIDEMTCQLDMFLTKYCDKYKLDVVSEDSDDDYEENCEEDYSVNADYGDDYNEIEADDTNSASDIDSTNDVDNTDNIDNINYTENIADIADIPDTNNANNTSSNTVSLYDWINDITYEPVADFDNSLLMRLCYTDKKAQKFSDKCLMICSDYPNGDLDDDTINRFASYYENLSKEKQEKLQRKTEIDTTYIDDCLLEIPERSVLNSEDNILCLLTVLQWIRKEENAFSETEIEEIIKEWIVLFDEGISDDKVFADITEDKENYIAGRSSYMYSDLEKYMIINVGKENTEREVV